MALSTDFAFEGFRLIRQRPMLIVFWGVLSLVVTGLTQFYMLHQFAPLIDQVNTLSMNAGPNDDPTEVLGLMGQLLPFYAVMMILSLGFYAVMNCAVYRAVNDEPNFGLGYLRLGMDEVRQLLVIVAFFFVFIAAYLALLLVVAIAGGLLMAGLSAINPALAMVGGVLMFVAIFGGIIWFMVRMSFYSVQTFHDKKFNLFGTWKLSKGHFWSLLAGYFIAVIMALLVYMLFGLIYLGVAAVAGLSPMELLSAMTNTQSPMPTAELYSHPLMIGFMVLGGLVLTPLVTAIVTGAPAAAYKAINTTDEAA